MLNECLQVENMRAEGLSQNHLGKKIINCSSYLRLVVWLKYFRD